MPMVVATGSFAICCDNLYIGRKVLLPLDSETNGIAKDLGEDKVSV
ncbi:MAG: hypothetical protein ABIH53_04885 [archaeon]